MKPAELVEGYIKRLRSANGELNKLEKAANKLQKTQEDRDVKHAAYAREIENLQDSIRGLQEEDAEVRGKLLDTWIEDDTATLTAYRQRRRDIATALEEAQQQVQELTESIEALPDYTKEAAEVAAKLDSLKWGDAYGFALKLRDALVEHQSEQNSRVREARGQLGKYDQEAYKEIRAEHDDQFAREQEKLQLNRRVLQQQAERKQPKPYASTRSVTDDEGRVVGFDLLSEDGRKIGFREAKWVAV